MKISFYFPCCIARYCEIYYRNYKRKNEHVSYISVGCLVLFMILICITMRGILLNVGFICSAEVIASEINNICNNLEHNAEKRDQVLLLQNGEQSRGVPTMNLCSELCQPNSDVTQRIECQGKHLSKAFVFSLNLVHDQEEASTVSQHDRLWAAVVKSVVENSNEDVEHGNDESYWKSSNPLAPLPKREEFLNMVWSIVSLSVGAAEDNEGLQLLLTSANRLYDSRDQSMQLHRSFWQFVEDQEFLMTLLLEETRLFPRLYDTCDNFYAVEYVETLPENIFMASSMKRNEKLMKAIDVVRYVEKLDSAWSEPLHLCDVKMPHFGWAESGQVKFVDVDTVMTQSLLVDNIRNIPHCDSDEDCTFFDCAARCDRSSARCLPARTNSNLQVVCRKVFLGQGSSSMHVVGLLQEEAEEALLQDALQLCATNPGMTAQSVVEALQQAYGMQAA